MQAKTLLPDVRHLQCDRIRWDGSRLVVLVSSSATTAVCPRCGQPSSRIHSHYQRRLQDLPWLGVAIREQWCSRRFFCDNTCCRQRIFTERLPELAAPYARKTRRLADTLEALGLACGGEGGAQLARRLGIPTSPDTVLREIRRSVKHEQVSVRVLGVDDWALRRGQRYGTILVDLEAHRTIDLLPDRSSESFAAWLGQHPEIEVVARDRGEHYGQGASLGAPQAVQVADRWHLLQNVREALTRTIERFPQELRQATPPVSAVVGQASPAEPAMRPLPTPELPAKPRQPRWQEKYKQVIELYAQKRSARAIARELALDRGTVRRWLKAGRLPNRVGRRRGSRVDAWQEYLATRWQAGCHNAVILAKELREQGFIGSYYPVRRFVSQWRSHEATGAIAIITRPRPPSAKSIAWWLLTPPEKRTADQQHCVEIFCAACPLAAKGAAIAEEFARMVRGHDLARLDDWLRQASSSEIPIEMRRFASGIQADLAAVQGALSLPWSNGQTEGQVNRLKLIKRQMFGRANFDLLRQRVLARPA